MDERPPSTSISLPPFVTLDDIAALVPADESSGTADDRAEGRVVWCDVRTAMGGGNPTDDFANGHVPGAVLVDLDRDLADPPAGTAGRHPLPAPERFAARLGALGISSTHIVIAYDAAVGGFAARLVWMLRAIGQPAALLDGGLGAWTSAGRPLETGPGTSPLSVERSAVAWPEQLLADADAVTAHIAAGGVVVDSRDAARYRGEHEPIDPIAGHIPGAINLPFTDNLDGTGRLRATDELAARFAPLRKDSAAIVSCGSGVTACHNALAAEQAGLSRPRLYVGSWSGWCADTARPVATTA